MPRQSTSTYNSMIEVYVDSQHLEAQLTELNIALSPMSLAKFLTLDMLPWLEDRAANRFNSEGDDVSGPWAPLRPATEAIRSSQGFGASHPINVRTHELERYITGGSGTYGFPTGAGAALVYPTRTAPSGELRQKVLTAQQGRDNPRTVPRPVLGVNASDMTFALTSLSLYIVDGWKTP